MVDARELVSRSGLRCTQQRVAIYDALRSTKSHPTAEELFRMVRPSTQHLSLATVYNALESFCEVGLAKKLATNNGCSRYDADVSSHMHIRFSDTAEIADVPAELSQRLMSEISTEVLADLERELGVSIDGVSVQLIGRHRNHDPAVV